MPVTTLRIPESAEGRESLTVSLQAVAKSGGLDLDYDCLHAVLGLSFMTCAVEGEESPSVWAGCGRDWHLVEAARFLGIQMRPLHPAGAAAGLNGVEEYRAHFLDSYAPLIRQALDHGHPVLAWQGWPPLGTMSPPPAASQTAEARRLVWGVITDVHDGGLGFRGVSPLPGGERVMLAGPAVQCYVVETVEPTDLPDRDVVVFALAAAQMVLHGRVGPQLGVATGGPAYDMWRSRLETDLGTSPAARPDGRMHSTFARSIAAARASAIRFLRGRRNRLDPGCHAVLDAVTERCEAVAGALALILDDATVQQRIESTRGRRELLAVLEAAKDADGALARSVDELADALSE